MALIAHVYHAYLPCSYRLAIPQTDATAKVDAAAQACEEKKAALKESQDALEACQREVEQAQAELEALRERHTQEVSRRLR